MTAEGPDWHPTKSWLLPMHWVYGLSLPGVHHSPISILQQLTDFIPGNEAVRPRLRHQIIQYLCQIYGYGSIVMYLIECQRLTLLMQWTWLSESSTCPQSFVRPTLTGAPPTSMNKNTTTLCLRPRSSAGFSFVALITDGQTTARNFE